MYSSIVCIKACYLKYKYQSSKNPFNSENMKCEITSQISLSFHLSKHDQNQFNAHLIFHFSRNVRARIRFLSIVAKTENILFSPQGPGVTRDLSIITMINVLCTNCLVSLYPFCVRIIVFPVSFILSTTWREHWLIDWLFTVLHPAQEFFTYMETSPLPVKGCKI
jgi:hypothetical protein